MQAPKDTPAPPPAAPRADLGRLSIPRGAETAHQPRGFPWLRAAALLAVLAVLFLFRAPLLAFVGASGKVTVRTARALRIVPGQARQGDVAANGYIVADTQASLASILSGRLVELNAAEGDIVEAGAVVARIQFDDLEVQQRQAQAGRAGAEARREQARAARLTAAARVAEALRAVEAAALTATQFAAEQAAQAQRVERAADEAARLAREVERNRSLYEQRRIDAGTWDRIQTEARAAQNDLEAARAQARAAEAATAAWQGEIQRRRAAHDVAKADEVGAEKAAAAADAGLDAARQDEALADILLEKTRIRAPFRGLVIRKDAEKGEVIAPTGAGNSRGSVLTIVDPESLEVQVELSERRIGGVHAGDRALVFLDADPEQALPGVVRKIWPRADRSKGSIEVRVTLDERPPSLRPEMAARVVFQGGAAPVEAGPAWVGVPRAAVATRGAAKVVFVVSGGVARMRAVTLGAERGDRVEVTSGLQGGETVVLDPSTDLEDGSPVGEEQA